MNLYSLTTGQVPKAAVAEPQEIECNGMKIKALSVLTANPNYSTAL
jgi:hypothetical protein